MGFGIRIEVFGDYALFTRPEMKVERVSYDVMTPSAARGIIEAIYWKPAILWVVDKIYVCNEIAFTNIRRNELAREGKQSKISTKKVERVMNGSDDLLYLNTNEMRQQRASLLLTNVRYVIEAHFELTDKAGPDDTKEKHYNIILRRVRKGQHYHMPCFGCREFPAQFRLVEDEMPPVLQETRDLGFMLYDMDYSDPQDITPVFFRAKLENGILDLSCIEKVR